MSDHEERETPAAPAGRYGRTEPVTLDGLADLMSDGFASTLGEQRKTNRTVKIIEGRLGVLEGRFDAVEDRVAVVESHLFPSQPPKAPRAAAPSISEVTDATKSDVDRLEGRLLAVEARAGAIDQKADAALSINKQQSRAMGLAKPDAPTWAKVGRFIASREGVKALAALTTLIAALAAAIHGQQAQQAAQAQQARPLPAQVAPR